MHSERQYLHLAGTGSHRRPGLLQAMIDQLAKVRFAGTHDRIRAAPVDLHGAIRSSGTAPHVNTTLCT